MSGEELGRAGGPAAGPGPSEDPTVPPTELVGPAVRRVAHDFNNVFQVIRLEAQDLTSGDLPPEEVVTAANAILEMSDRAADLIQRLRDLAGGARNDAEGAS